MRTSDEIISDQFEQLSKSFRPVFGNQNHIDIANYLGEIVKLEKTLKQKKEAAANINVIEEKIGRLKSQALYLLKNYAK